MLKRLINDLELCSSLVLHQGKESKRSPADAVIKQQINYFSLLVTFYSQLPTLSKYLNFFTNLRTIFFQC